MSRFPKSLKLFIPAVLLILSALSCDNDTTEPPDYGDPPEISKTFCDAEGIEVYLAYIAETYPALTDLREIGRSVDGRTLYVIEISDNPGTDEEEPAVFIGGGIHGHEQVSAGTAMHLLEDLLEAYPDNPEAADIIDNYKLNIMPAINPDGLDDGNRYNSNGVDINRNFGFHWSESENYNGEEAFDQPESAALRDDIIEEGYSSGLILHTASFQSGIGIYGPWDSIPSDDEDFYTGNMDGASYAVIESTGEAYSETLTATAGYPYSMHFHYEAGADWYILYGSVNDWALGVTGSVLYSVELYGDQYFTTGDAVLLEEIWDRHKQSMLDFIRSNPEW
ncbi:MAG: DUF2817 domain-containing protein [Spirochaetales bacterium]|uniref:DUF2817 domain-containing protein n=1 Tax=Candidatus Thalassospirochaeta sargassi TaxID=3119039 RepID=A0AAJ1IF57_9SPIO|nr:DUF2817 domain-containing protein [Spirochaetales bacterium]